MHQSEGSPLMIPTNRPSIISEGQIADEFHYFTIMYFPPLPLVGSPAGGEALRVFSAAWSSGLSLEQVVVEHKVDLHPF